MNAPEALPCWPEQQALKVVGRNSPRASAREKVTGRAEYASDVVQPGQVHAVLLRSTVARGRVTGFDASAALALPGVLRVLGPFEAKPLPGIAFTNDPAFRTRPVIDAHVRFVGEEIGVVVATSEPVARAAARRITVEYQCEPACLSVDAALADGAPQLGAHGNLAMRAEFIEHGDMGAAESAADVVVEQHYATDAQHHNPLEPHGCVAAWQGDVLTLWDSSQGPHMIREHMAQTFGLPLDRVRVISRYVGGGFGSKINLKPYHVIAAEAARRVGCPVRLFMARREEFIASHQRAATRRRIRLGASYDGQLRFIDQSITGQAGPSAFFARNAAGAANGLRLHRADAVRAEVRRVLTNTQAPIPFRGPTAAEDIFCFEQAIDELAHALQMDPLAFRQKNMAEIDVIAGLPYAGKQLQRCYELGARAFGWHWRVPGARRHGDKARGIGMGAAAYDGTLYEASRAEVACLPGGYIEVRVGVTEIGCGADTVFAQIAAEELGLPVARVHTHLGDTASTPRSIDATNHSRTTAVVGPAVRAAAQALKAALLRAGAERLCARVDELVLNEVGVCVRADPSRQVSLAALLPDGEPLVGAADRERGPQGVFAAMFAAHFVEVEVDTRTGRVTVLRAVCAHDAGRIINPRLAQSQVHGGFLQGMGMALQEQRTLDGRTGVQLNAAMWAYRTPSIVDAPLSIRFVDAGEASDGGNSLGVKGIGEPPLIASGAAIGNAVCNAIGVRLRSYPITPDKVLAALGEARP